MNVYYCFDRTSRDNIVICKTLEIAKKWVERAICDDECQWEEQGNGVWIYGEEYEGVVNEMQLIESLEGEQ